MNLSTLHSRAQTPCTFCRCAAIGCRFWSRSGSYAPAQSVLALRVCTLRYLLHWLVRWLSAASTTFSALCSVRNPRHPCIPNAMRLLWPCLGKVILTDRTPFRAAQSSPIWARRCSDISVVHSTSLCGEQGIVLDQTAPKQHFGYWRHMLA